MTSLNLSNYQTTIKMNTSLPKKSSLSPTISSNKNVIIINNNNNNESLLNVNLNKTEYDSTSIASISESSHWSTGNGDDENIALVPGAEALIENKDWSTYLNDKNTYNSSDDENDDVDSCNNKINKKKRIENLMNDNFDDDDDDDDESKSENTHNVDNILTKSEIGNVMTTKRNTLTKDDINNKKFYDGDSDNTEENLDNQQHLNYHETDEDDDNNSVKRHSDNTDYEDNNNNNNNDDDENNNSDGNEEEEEEDDDDDDDDDDEDDFDGDDIYTIKPKLAKYYEKQFKSMQSDLNGVISGVVAKSFFEKSKLPLNELSKIWELSDINRDGALSYSEFCTAMHLVVLRVRNFDLPEQLPPKLQPYTPLIDFESDENLVKITNNEKVINTETSNFVNEKDSTSSILSNNTIISPIVSDSPIAFANNFNKQNEKNIAHPIPLRHPKAIVGSTPTTVVRPPFVAPSKQHSRSSSLGSITNRVQPPAVPPREQTQNDIDVADSASAQQQQQQQPPPLPPPPPPPPPPSYPPILLPPPLPPLPTSKHIIQQPVPIIYQQNQVENMVEQMHNLNIEHIKKLNEQAKISSQTQKQQCIDELQNQIKLQKENQIKLKKFLTDLEKEYRNLTDTRIALEIKYESLNNGISIDNSNNISILNGNNNNNNNNTVTQPQAISPLASTSSSAYI